jgi:peptidoglycan/xylan/chitin deacetylase (PgdA/CDA1 family)
MGGTLALKIDVDTDRGTREGVLPLSKLCQRLKVPATFFFSLGPDNTGRAIRRIFRPGFFKKVARTNVTGNYGLRTLLNGTLLPAPQIGQRHADVIRSVAEAGFETGIHCHDHFTWQDYVHTMSREKVRLHFQQAFNEFHRILGRAARCAAAPGWQCCANSLAVYDEFDLLYASDARGLNGFRPAIGGITFRTPQIPTDLPTLDELLGDPDFPLDRITDEIVNRSKAPGFHVLTIHSELEGMAYLGWMEDLLEKMKRAEVQVVPLSQFLDDDLPVHSLDQGEVPGRSGQVAVKGQSVA